MNSEAVKAEAARLGFERCGVALARKLPDGENLKAFVESRLHGTMDWLSSTVDKRADIGTAYPWVRSVIVAALSHKPAEDRAPGRGEGLVARYAGGADYHVVLTKKLRELRNFLRRGPPASHAVAVVDTETLMEKPWARESGVAWIGKHTNGLDPRLGSYFSLGVVMSELVLEPDAPAIDHCGSCTACLEACPTQALTAPYRIDGSRCISYLTIEHRGPIDEALRPGMGAWVFGCDLCQEACPWNREAPATREPAFVARPGLSTPRLGDWLSMDEAAFQAMTRGTALRRAKRNGLRRNAAIAMGNSGDPAARPALMEAAGDADPVVAEAARWALGRLKPNPQGADT
ncbi:MAG: tRNA epoxyqueuosine(34) reductase QueG [Planctomycetes bacterium]|nr:tRNA epoxyqueuosine(34) reductase QueG [Planctomycetota bacterium]